MKSYKFYNKQDVKMYTIFTILGVILSITIFSNMMDSSLKRSFAYLFVTILSFISIMVSIKQSSKQFSEIVIDDEKIKFYFQNKMKSPLTLPKKEVAIINYDDIVEFRDLSNNFIGKAYKNKIVESEKWNELCESIDRFHTS